MRQVNIVPLYMGTMHILFNSIHSSLTTCVQTPPSDCASWPHSGRWVTIHILYTTYIYCIHSIQLLYTCTVILLYYMYYATSIQWNGCRMLYEYKCNAHWHWHCTCNCTVTECSAIIRMRSARSARSTRTITRSPLSRSTRSAPDWLPHPAPAL